MTVQTLHQEQPTTNHHRHRRPQPPFLPRPRPSLAPRTASNSPLRQNQKRLGAIHRGQHALRRLLGILQNRGMRPLFEPHHRSQLTMASGGGAELEAMSSPTLVDRFNKIGWTVTESGCWEWNGSRHVTGYGQIYGTESTGPLKTHRLAYLLWKGVIPDGMVIRHHCDNPPCINPDHLDYGTHRDNSQDAVQRRRANHQVMTGEHCPASKLTWDQVRQIRASNMSGVDLAKMYGVDKSSISSIRLGKTWKEKGSVTTRRI